MIQTLLRGTKRSKKEDIQISDTRKDESSLVKPSGGRKEAPTRAFGSSRARVRRQSVLRTSDGARDEAKGDGAQGDESNGGYVLLHKDDDDANDDAT